MVVHKNYEKFDKPVFFHHVTIVIELSILA